MECAAICDSIAMVDSRLKQKTEIGKTTLKSVVNILSAVCNSNGAGAGLGKG